MFKEEVITIDNSGRYEIRYNKRLNMMRVFDLEQKTCPASMFVKIKKEDVFYCGYRIMREYRNKNLIEFLYKYFNKRYKKNKFKFTLDDKYSIELFRKIGLKESIQEKCILFSYKKILNLF